ncbi:MAG: hypothetical protein ACE5JO_02915 [Candidatus Binatia bacterium]
MNQPNLGKLDRLHKYTRELKDVEQSITAQLFANRDETSRLEALLPQLTGNPNELDLARKQIAELKEKRAVFQKRYSQTSDDLMATIALINICEEWLRGQGISIPPNMQARHSSYCYRR